MATRGKHRRDPQRPSKYGKHAAATRPVHDPLMIALSALLLAALVMVPFSLNRLLVALDASFSLGGSPFSASPLAGVAEDVIGAAEGGFEEFFAAVPSDAAFAPKDPSTSLPAVGYAQRVGELRQNALMEGGCELVSLAIVLDAMGLSADVHRIVSNHLVVDGHFATGYSGDPYYRGGGFPEGIAKAANGYLAEIGSGARAVPLTDVSFEEVATYVAKGYPVLAWTTMGFTDPQFTGAFDGGREWYANEHCVVLYGVGDETVAVSDPLEGLVQREVGRFAQIYEACGSMALVIL